MWAKTYDGTTWVDTEGGSVLESSLSTANYQNFDFAFRKSGYERTFSEPITITDAVSVYRSFIQSLSESAAISDQLITVSAFTRSLSDFVLLTDTMSIQGSFVRSVSDSVVLTDSINITKSWTISLLESLDLSDFVSMIYAGVISMSESLDMSDTLSTTVTLLPVTPQPSTEVPHEVRPGGHRTGVSISGGGIGGQFVDILLPPGIELIPAPSDFESPRIFDVKFQIGNGTKMYATETTEKYVKNQPLSVYALVHSPTPLIRAEIRFLLVGDEPSNYSVIEMNITPLEIPDIYSVSGTISQKLMKGPVMIYWIRTINEAAGVADSGKYVIGIKPDYSLKGILEMDTLQNVAGGFTHRPKIYFTNNAEGPLYGIVSLDVDGKTVYTFPAELYGVGQSEIILEWNVPKPDTLTKHAILARAEFYNQALETKEIKINTFAATKIASLSELNTIQLIRDRDGSTVAHPAILYSSFRDDGNLRYHVIAPDGTCVIGSSDKCHVNGSTSGQRGHMVSVVIKDQIYRVEYSGSDAPLERFSITSTDPMVGRWNITIETEDGLIQKDIMKDVELKIKYLPEKIPFVLSFSE